MTRIVRTMTAHRLFFIVVAAVVTFACGEIPALAHANLVRSIPAPNAILDSAPTSVLLWFSEVPEPSLSSVTLYDKDGGQIAGVGMLHLDPRDPNNALKVVASLPPLRNGLYSIAWKALSASDGHVTAGSFAFVIGRDQAALLDGIAAPLTSDTSPSLPTVLTRWILYLTLAALLGGFAFVPLIFQPALDRLPERELSNTVEPSLPVGPFSHESGLFEVLWCATLILFLALVGGAFVQANTAGANPFTLITTTHYAGLFWGEILFTGALGALLMLRQSRRWRRDWAGKWWLAGTVISALLMLMVSLGSHGAANPDPLIPVAIDWLHLLAMGIWLGGLLALLLALRFVRRSSELTAALLISRFSQVATVCVLVISITGVLHVFFEVGDLVNLIDTPYGLTLLAKLGLLLPVLALGSVNLLVVERRLKRILKSNTAINNNAVAPLTGFVGRTVRIEIGFIVAIVLVTAILTNLTPAREAFGSGLIARAQAADLRIIVAASPGLAGANTIEVVVKDALNRPIADAIKVAILVSMTTHDMGTSEIVAKNAGEGRYTAVDSAFSMVGTWKAEILVRRAHQDDVRADILLPIGSIQPSGRTVVTSSRVLLAGEILLLGLAVLANAARFERTRRRLGQMARFGGLIAVLVSVGVGVLAYTDNSCAQVLNPVAADSASFMRGNAVYQQNCVACHGATGLGDGALADSLNPRPANFQVHMNQGHPDGQLFDWISNGIPGSAMQGWASKLSETERWDVINYIKTFRVP